MAGVNLGPPDPVSRLFDEAASDYDAVSALMTFGSGAWYRRAALQRAGLGPGMRVLDIATGTGLMAREARRIVGRAGAVTGIDASAGMLARATRALPGALTQGRGEHLPFRPGQFDFAILGYALRHLDQPSAFAEMLRVLRPGGVACILEIGAPASGPLRRALGLYIGRLVPLVSRVIGARTVTRDLWRYYWRTIERALPATAVLQNLSAAGFEDVRRHVAQHIFYEYTARKPRLDSAGLLAQPLGAVVPDTPTTRRG
jgi:demethylmenaquinone methyltransferase/2-methoxy-6-polyprenyl-1,4-benzoquinol methylase